MFIKTFNYIAVAYKRSHCTQLAIRMICYDTLGETDGMVIFNWIPDPFYATFYRVSVCFKFDNADNEAMTPLESAGQSVNKISIFLSTVWKHFLRCDEVFSLPRKKNLGNHSLSARQIKSDGKKRSSQFKLIVCSKK
jgi:hypothetical protein